MDLINDLKQELKIFDNEEDEYLSKIIKKGAGRLQGLTGTALDFESNTLAHELLMTYGRYYYNNGEEYFEENNAYTILRLQFEEGVLNDNKR